MRNTLFIALISLITFGCGKCNTCEKTVVSPYNVKVNPSSVAVTKSDSGTSINVGSSGTIIVKLVEDPTKNLKWVIATPSTNLQSISETKQTPQPNYEVRIFQFKAANIGSAHITFAYGPYTHEINEAISTVNYTFVIQ